MKANPFSIKRTSHYFVVRDPRKQFIRRVSTLGQIFLVVVLFVFLEIRHYHELYEMSRRVGVAELQARQAEERLRLEQAREAAIEAELQNRLSPGRNSRDSIMVDALAGR
jgi:hypothetical protein